MDLGEPRYAANEKLPAVCVDLDLLSELETYIERKAKQFAPEVPFKEAYQLTILDKSGQEELASIRDFPYSRLSDDTERVTLRFWSERGLEVRVRFGPKRESTGLRVAYAGPSAREVVRGIVREITAIIASRRSLNALFNPPPKVAGAIFIGFLVAMGAADRWLSEPYSGRVIVTLIGVGVGLLVLAARFPFTAFDTPAYQRKVGALKWFGLLLIGFLITGVFLTSLRRQMLGF